MKCESQKYLTHLINSPEARVAFARSEVMEDMLLALISAKEKNISLSLS